MKTFLKQLFCVHIYKQTKKELLREECEKEQSLLGTYVPFYYNIYLIEELCLKCGKVYKYEKKYWNPTRQVIK